MAGGPRALNKRTGMCSHSHSSKTVGGALRGKNLLLHCDNESTVAVVNRGAAKNKFTQACLRELVWWTAKFDLWIKVVFLAGVDNRYADLCSRLHLSDYYKTTLAQETENYSVERSPVDPEMFEFVNRWKF